jgi:hypothetical protein
MRKTAPLTLSVEPTEKVRSKNLQEKQFRIWHLSDDLGPGEHLGTPDLDIFLSSEDFFSLVRVKSERHGRSIWRGLFDHPSVRFKPAFPDRGFKP